MPKVLRKSLPYLAPTVLLAVIFALLFCPRGSSGPAAPRSDPAALGNVIGADMQGNRIRLTVDNGPGPSDDLLTLEICKSDVLRVDYQPDSGASSPNTPMIDPNLKWDPVKASVDMNSDPITIQTAAMKIEIAKKPCRITVKKANGTLLFREPSSGGVYRGGVRFVRASATNMYGVHGYDCFTGGGQLLRNNCDGEPTAAGQQGNSGGPFLWSTAGYGILVDADGGFSYTDSADKKMEFCYGDDPTGTRRYTKKDVEYFILLGEPKEIMRSFSKITGTSPMMPKWSLGFLNFEWGINEKELTNMVDTYRAKNIPLDGYAFDYDWKKYGSDNYGETAWNTANFPSASTGALKQKMDAKGVKLIGIMKPRIVTKLTNGTQTVQGRDAEAGDFFYPGHKEYTDYFLPVTVRSIDPYRADVRAWWWQHSIDAFRKGIAAWWNDEDDLVSSGRSEYQFGNFTTLHLSQAMYEGQKSYTRGTQRVCQFARTFYPGAQRYATSLWSGDVGIQFHKGDRMDWVVGLNEQRASLLSAINNGQPKWGSDGGGFNPVPGTNEAPDPELYTRWMQLASVSPVFRVHGMNQQQRQPWYFGSTAEEVSKAAIRLRYSLIPYLYAYEREAFDTGLGMVRPLLFDYPSDPKTANDSDAWMLGDWLLVAPITERGQSEKTIYLPAGRWIDFNRGTVYNGGQNISYKINRDSWTDLPMFIREGAVVPSQTAPDSIGQKAVNPIRFDIFPSKEKTGFCYYDDDGISYRYENGNFLKQTVSAQAGARNVTIRIEAKTGTYDNGVSDYCLAVHGRAAASVTENGSGLPMCADFSGLSAAKGPAWAVGKDLYGDVTYIKVAAGCRTGKNIVLSGSNPVKSGGLKYEAEEASLSGSTDASRPCIGSSQPGYSGSGYADNFSGSQAAVTFYAKAARAGNYTATLRYSNNGSSVNSLSVSVNGKPAGKAEFRPTGRRNGWANASLLLPLSAGNNCITLKAGPGGGAIRLDYMQVPLSPK